MADVPLSQPPSGELELAAALDEALEALRTGQPLDRAALTARHPALAGLLDQLLTVLAPTVGHNGAVTAPVNQPAQVGPYRIERELGAGGFGVVYLGFDPDVKRRVAVKLLHPGRMDDPEALARFHREACAMGRLRHPGIVQLFDYSRQGPPWYLVTEYVEGEEPRLWCQRRGATPSEVAELVARISDGVEYAHRQGVCHRDLKPGNVLVDEGGQPKVLDFGLARLDSGQSSARTSDGHVLGSLAYMPPEQASGLSHTADARSDVYSLGVILYELLTGQLPFQGPAHELPARVLEGGPPPPRQLVPDLPRDLEAVCLKALARRPQDRYASAADLAADLRAFAEGRAVEARPLSMLGSIRRVLERRHLEMLRQWPALLLTVGTSILAGCLAVNYLERALEGKPAWLLLAVLLTKGTQFLVMLGLALWLWPAQQGGGARGRWRWADRTPAERQAISMVPGYYGSYLVLLALNAFVWKEPIPTAPVLALLAAMGFLNLGATVWGWFYVYGAGFLAVAVLAGLAGPYGTSVLGVGWFGCLLLGGVHLRLTR